MTEFESIILKTLITDSEYFRKVMPILKAKHFTEIGNSKTFSILKELYEKYDKIPNTTELIGYVKNIPNEEIRQSIIKALQPLSNIEKANTEYMLDETVKFVKDAMYLEALELGSEGLMSKNDDLKLKAERIMDERAHIHIDDDLGLDFNDIQEMIEYYSERNIGLRTSSKELNKRLGSGFLPKTLSLFCAPSSGGKSLLMTHIISDLLKKNKNILLVSLEMHDREIMKRIHANALDLPINSLTDLSKTEGELKQLDRPIISKDDILRKFQEVKTSGKLGKLFIKEYSPGEFSSLQLEALVKDYELQKGIKFDIIFVDYLGIMKSDRIAPSAGLYSYVKSIAEELRASAVKLNVPIISAQQLNRGAVNNKEADNSAISDSLGSVMTADFIMFLLQDEEMKAQNEICMKVTKNRFNGRTDTFLMNIDYEKMRFSDMIFEGSGDIPVLKSDGAVMGDFGIVTKEKQNNAELFADSEVKKIEAESWKNIKEADSKVKEPKDSLQDIFDELGL